MTLAGYWDGVHPDGPIDAGLSAPPRRVHVRDTFRGVDREWYIQATELDMHLYWDKAFHSLRQSGVDFVKIDAQAEWEWIRDVVDADAGSELQHTRRASMAPLSAEKLAKAAFEAMEGAATRYFGAGGGVVHSMAFTSALTNTSRTLHSQGLTIRCTDDFFPQIPEAHRHHIAHNVYNSMLLPEHRCDATCSRTVCSPNVPKDSTTQASMRLSVPSLTPDSGCRTKLRAHQDASLRALVSPPTLTEAKQGPPYRPRVACFLTRSLMISSATKSGLLSNSSFSTRAPQVAPLVCGTCAVAKPTHSMCLTSISFFKANICRRPHRHAVQLLRGQKLPNRTDSGSRHRRQSEATLTASLTEGSWDVLTVSPLLTTLVQGVSIALLGSNEHFMTPEGITSITISTVYPVKKSRKRRTASKTHRPAHHRSRSSRSSSTLSDASFVSNSHQSSSDESALTLPQSII